MIIKQFKPERETYVAFNWVVRAYDTGEEELIRGGHVGWLRIKRADDGRWLASCDDLIAHWGYPRYNWRG